MKFEWKMMSIIINRMGIEEKYMQFLMMDRDP
jgi:hypothetical protein